MKLALAATPVRNRDLAYNLRTMLRTLEEYRGKVDVILFGEATLQGFDCLCWDYKTDRPMAAALEDAPIRCLQEAAKAAETALSFGFIERCGDVLYSSQLFIGADGRIVDRFHRVSVGWKEFTKTDCHYREGPGFTRFRYGEKTFATGLCGDLWTDGRPEEMRALDTDVVLWPVWCDYSSAQWNTSVKHEYAQQAALCGENVLLVNPFCADPGAEDVAQGGAAWFRRGRVVAEIPAGQSGVLIVEI